MTLAADAHGTITGYLQQCSLYLRSTGLPAVQKQAAAAGFVCRVKCTASRQLFHQRHLFELHWSTGMTTKVHL